MEAHVAIRDDISRRIRCAHCGGELAELEAVSGVSVHDADGYVCEHRINNDRLRICFGAGWYPTPEGPWRRDIRPAGHARGPTSLAVLVREMLGLWFGPPRDGVPRRSGVIEAICPECESKNAIQMEAAE